MYWIRGLLVSAAVVTVVGLQCLNWRAQRQTQQKLDALTATLAARQPEVIPVPQPPKVEPGAVPRQLEKVKLPPYVIEAPDQLTIEVVAKDPKTGTTDRLPTQPVSGSFQVRPDGTVGLGLWGSVAVSGLTLEQAADAVRSHIAKRAEQVPAENLRVVVDVLAYNSKRYYVITDTPGKGEQVFVFPVTGSETVLDAVAGVTGLAEVAGKSSVRIARRSSDGGQSWQQLPVDWTAITRHGMTNTNYQILPGDRIYVTRAAD